MLSDVRKKELRESLGIGTESFVFIFIGRRTHFKGFAATVRAFLAFNAKYTDSRLVLVGQKDPLHPTGLTVEEDVAVRRCGAIVDAGWTEDVNEFLGISHVNVFPSDREGMPVNLMESLAMGVPVITIASRGCREVVRNGVDGIVLEGITRLRQLRVEVLVSAMQHLYQNRACLASMRAHALRRRDEFDRRRWIRGQLEVYEEVRLRKSSSP
jgi:glycosyltransferase involved in cell wall biosynthesis